MSNNKWLKYLFALVIEVVVVVLAMGYGFHLANKKAFSATRGAFVATLSAAEKLRDGKSDDALKVIDNHCYSSALRLLDERGSEEDFTIVTLLPDLIAYRAKFANSKNEWTPVEHRLEELIKVQHSKLPARR